MLGSIKDFKYKLVKNFLTKEETELLKQFTILFHQRNDSSFDTKQSITMDTMDYGNPATDALLITKLKKMEEETKLKLNPTYSFWRMYTKYAVLKKHKDRPSCEISCTVMAGSDNTPWPIYIDGTPLEMQPGDAAIYLGCDVEHWREEFQGDWHSQIFLHYVDANGPFKDYQNDQREITETGFENRLNAKLPDRIQP